VPALQFTQVLSKEAPTVIEYFPAGHGKHETADIALEFKPYLPATHFTQVMSLFAPVAAEYEPATQFTQKELLEAPNVIE
jgi:hypothetical protein